MKIGFVKHQTHCEHCGTPISNVYIVEEPETGFKIRVGSTCIQHFTRLKPSGIDYVVKELKNAEKHKKHKHEIEEALTNQDTEKLQELMKVHAWQYDYATIEEAAERWIELSQIRYEKRVEELNQKLAKNTVIKPK